MTKKKQSNKIALFEDQEIRRILVDDEYFYSVIDVIQALTDSDNPRRYWSDLKKKIENEENTQLYEIIVQLKLPSKKDGKKYLTDVADTEGLLRIIQSIPSKKAEPFKIWLARIGKERLDEIEQPAKAIERAKGYYLAKGYPKNWVETRTLSIDTRNTFTEALKGAGIKENVHYAILTNDMYKSWSTFTAGEYKEHKGLSDNDSLRDNMTPLELATTIFNEATTTEIIEKTNPDGYFETKKAVNVAGSITKEAIKKIEEATGKKVVTHENAKELDNPEVRKKLAQESLPEKPKEITKKDLDESTDKIFKKGKPKK